MVKNSNQKMLKITFLSHIVNDYLKEVEFNGVKKMRNILNLAKQNIKPIANSNKAKEAVFIELKCIMKTRVSKT